MTGNRTTLVDQYEHEDNLTHAMMLMMINNNNNNNSNKTDLLISVTVNCHTTWQ